MDKEKKDKEMGPKVSDNDAFRAAGDKESLAAAYRGERERVAKKLMDAGVTVIDPTATYVDDSATVGEGTILYPNTFIEGNTVIGKGCVIDPSVRIVNSRLGDDVKVLMCTLIIESTIGDGVTIGPFAHLRPGAELEEGSKVGNFVEVKKSKIGRGSKANHLSYIGDAQIGEGVNVGAGMITCNYDGVNKHRTEIGDNVFIGSDVQLVAPVKLGKNALIGAGSTITKDVPEDALAVTRARQTNLPGKGFLRFKEKLTLKSDDKAKKGK
jgi:bifunctional UDP-N-acetylglucosamine pyrophosphorylase/glucosamine-1-phosphate N-acetyltransferase